MSSNDLDPHLIKCIGLLYESKKLRKGDQVPLQYVLEEAIFQKTGVVKNYTDFFQSQLPPRESEEPTVASNIYEEKENSDDDLELDLFKDDLSCIICNKMDVGARNRLLECSDCHALYHQECHKPTVGEEEVTDTWTCSNCRNVSTKRMKTSEKDHGSSKSSSSSKSESHRHGSNSSHKSSSDKHKSSSSKSSSKSSSTASPSHSSSRSEDKKSSSKSSKSSSSKYYSEKRKHD